MSWFFGLLGESRTEFEKNFKARNTFQYSQYVNGDLCIFYDNKINSSHNLQQSSNTQDKFLVVGIGISESEQKYVLSLRDWEKTLLDEKSYLQLDGHFAILKFNSLQLTLLTDPLGLRDIYVAKINSKEILFSTRIDLLLQFVRSEIDLGIFGSRWLLFNQISQRSVLKGIDRIVGGSSVTIDRRTQTIARKSISWMPIMNPHEMSSSLFANKIERIAGVRSEEKNKIGLLLSGGMDSRTLISIMLAQEPMDLTVFTFGNEQSADLKVAKQISRDFALPHIIVDPDKLDISNALSDFKKYSTQTFMNNSFSSFLHLQSYNQLRKFDGILLDGGFGEIWRREFLYKLAFLGKGKIFAKDFNAIILNLKLHRADFFEQDVVDVMSKGLQNQIEEIYNLLPSPEEVGVDNWLDLFAIKTRLANHYSHEQTLSDQSLISIMPFVQQSVLSNLFGISANNKKDGKLYRSIIKEHKKDLVKYPLAKGEYLMPFGVSSFQIRLILKINRMIEKDKLQLSHKYYTLKMLTNQILDFVSSKNVLECGLYNRRKIEKIITLLSVGTGDNEIWNEIDWLLAFESFRQSVN